jgi:hypothetical protein
MIWNEYLFMKKMLFETKVLIFMSLIVFVSEFFYLKFTGLKFRFYSFVLNKFYVKFWMKIKIQIICWRAHKNKLPVRLSSSEL